MVFSALAFIFLSYYKVILSVWILRGLNSHSNSINSYYNLPVITLLYLNYVTLNLTARICKRLYALTLHPILPSKIYPYISISNPTVQYSNMLISVLISNRVTVLISNPTYIFKPLYLSTHN